MEVEPAWETEPLFTRILLHDPGRKGFFHKIDLFHTISLGIGKGFVASCISVIQAMVPGSSIEQRLKEISCQYISFCKDIWLQW